MFFFPPFGDSSQSSSIIALSFFLSFFLAFFDWAVGVFYSYSSSLMPKHLPHSHTKQTKRASSLLFFFFISCVGKLHDHSIRWIKHWYHGGRDKRQFSYISMGLFGAFALLCFPAFLSFLRLDVSHNQKVVVSIAKGDFYSGSITYIVTLASGVFFMAG